MKKSLGINWIEPAEISIPPDLQEAVGGHPLVAETLLRRGISSVDAARAFLDPVKYTPASPYELPAMDRAVERVETALRRGEKICVWGDFDVDGQTATTLLVSALRELGARLTYHIPVRKRESHGVNLPVLSQILDGDPSIGLLVTCDTGITAHEAVDYAQGHGVDVVITDHHRLPEELPRAKAVINSNRLPQGHPLHTLPGVGVAYKLVEALFANAPLAGRETAYLDLVALGVVADVAELSGDTRYLLQCGLKQIRAADRTGLRVMMELADLMPERVSEEHIGFILGPRLNALGRLDDPNPVVELLTTQDEVRARTLAFHLEALNSRRQLLTSQVTQGALAQIERDPALLDQAVLVLSHPDWPAGVIGIVASRLVERFHKPVILVATPEGALGRASARSVDGVDITAAIAAQSDLLEGYGGHTMAAGFAIQPERIPEFRRRISRTVAGWGVIPAMELAIDAYLPFSELSLELVADLERLAPFGPGNPALVLASRDVEVVSHQRVGRNHEHLVLTLEDPSGDQQTAIWWGGADEIDSSGLPPERFELAYTARASTFRGTQGVQIEWLAYRLPQEDSGTRIAPRKVEIIDYRGEPHPLGLLEQIEEPYQVWAEAEARQKLLERGLPARQRLELEPEPLLVVWTAPPDRAIWEGVLERLKPAKVVLVALPAKTDELGAFLARLGGLVKYALNRKAGRGELSEMAAAMAHHHHTIRAGLDWLSTQGEIAFLEERENLYIFASGSGEIATDAVESLDRLVALLGEARAYRAYFQRAEPSALLMKY